MLRPGSFSGPSSWILATKLTSFTAVLYCIVCCHILSNLIVNKSSVCYCMVPFFRNIQYDSLHHLMRAVVHDRFVAAFGKPLVWWFLSFDVCLIRCTLLVCHTFCTHFLAAQHNGRKCAIKRLVKYSHLPLPYTFVGGSEPFTCFHDLSTAKEISCDTLRLAST